MQELQCLFALMLGTHRKFVDPTAALELLKGAFRSPEEQQVKVFPGLGSHLARDHTWTTLLLLRFSAWLTSVPKISQPAERFNLKAVHNSNIQKRYKFKVILKLKIEVIQRRKPFRVKVSRK